MFFISDSHFWKFLLISFQMVTFTFYKWLLRSGWKQINKQKNTLKMNILGSEFKRKKKSFVRKLLFRDSSVIHFKNISLNRLVWKGDCCSVYEGSTKNIKYPIMLTKCPIFDWLYKYLRKHFAIKMKDRNEGLPLAISPGVK